MKHLDLFSGIGGFALAARWVGWETVGFCEIDPYCQKVLRKHWPDVPIYEDIRELDGRTVGHVDIITGGYPCQPFSVAGKRRGEADDRHLWPEFARLIQEIRPRWVVGENVAGHISMGLDSVLSDLEGCGYSHETFVIPACAVGAPHRRYRVWIIGYTHDKGQSTSPVNDEALGMPKAVGDNRSKRIQGSGKEQVSRQLGISWGEDGRKPPDQFKGWDLHTPRICRTRNGIPNGVDRTRGLGNAVVPQIPEVIFRAIQELENVRGSKAYSATRTKPAHQNETSVEGRQEGARASLDDGAASRAKARTP